MTSPFIFDVAGLLRGTGMPEQRQKTGPSPTRIGPEMIAIPKDGEVTVAATLTPLGDAIMADAEVIATLQGECSRCLRPLAPQHTLRVNTVFAAHEDFVTRDESEDDENEEIPLVEEDKIDLLQAVTDEAGLSLPFNPACEGGCPEDGEVPAPDGVVGEVERIDPRWAGLEKFK